MPKGKTGGASRKAKPATKAKKVVTAVYTAPGSRKAANTKAAVRALNREVGAKVVRTTKKRGKADVVVKANLKRGQLGLTYPEKKGRPTRVRVSPTRQTARKLGTTARRVTEHELGHAVGLAHKEPTFTGYDKSTGKWTFTSNKNNLMGVGSTGTHLSPGQKNKVLRVAKKANKTPPTYKKPT